MRTKAVLGNVKRYQVVLSRLVHLDAGSSDSVVASWSLPLITAGSAPIDRAFANASLVGTAAAPGIMPRASASIATAPATVSARPRWTRLTTAPLARSRWPGLRLGHPDGARSSCPLDRWRAVRRLSDRSVIRDQVGYTGSSAVK